MITIEQKGYALVQCEELLPCPFCGARPELDQISHDWQGNVIAASNEPLVADAFQFRCPRCHGKTGRYRKTAQSAAAAWNTRNERTDT